MQKQNLIPKKVDKFWGVVKFVFQFIKLKVCKVNGLYKSKNVFKR
jgi:sensor domain CHASE-containing protein